MKKALKKNSLPTREAEIKRLAAIYQRTVAGIEAVATDAAARQKAAHRLKRLQGQVARLARVLAALTDDQASEVLLVHVFRAHAAAAALPTDDEPGLQALLHYIAEIKCQILGLDQLARDFDAAADSLERRVRDSKGRGNQSTLALRFTIAAAIPAFVALTGRQPGRSRSDYNLFGRFVLDIIARIPQDMRPPAPQPSTIVDVITMAQRRVAKRSG